MSDKKYYAIVTFGSPWGFEKKSYYTSLDRACRDAQECWDAGGCGTVRVVECESRRDALDADISDRRTIVKNWG